MLNGAVRPGDNRWTCSIVALNPDTGKLAWGFQASPHDTHDWDAAEVPVLVDATLRRRTPRKLLMQASRNGYFFVLDRTTGKNLLTTPFAAVNWAKGIDERRPADSRPEEGTVARRRPGRAERKRRDQLPLAELRSRRPALFIVSAQDAYGIYFFKPEHGAYGWAGADYNLYGRSAAARDRLPDRQDPLEPRPRRRRVRRGRADDRVRVDVHGRHRGQRARAAHERRRDALARGHRPGRQLARSPTSSTGASTFSSAAGSALYAWALP